MGDLPTYDAYLLGGPYSGESTGGGKQRHAGRKACSHACMHVRRLTYAIPA